MSKAEKVVWMIVYLLAGMILGMLAASIIFSPKNTAAKCNEGMSEQIEVEKTYNFSTGKYEEKPVRKKTYIPANDTCKEGR